MSRYKELSQYCKQFDIFTNWIYYPIATFFCSILSSTSISPNSITFLAISFELTAFYLILTNFTQLAILIVLLLQFGWIFDLMDGMLARYKKMGYYHPTEPSNKGYYLDAVSDHILKFMIIAALGYELSKNHEFGWQIGMTALVIHAITQTEHTLRTLIKKRLNKPKNKNNNISTHVALVMNNIYLFYLIFIPMNRLDLLLIFFAGFEILLLLKRIILFWINEP